MVAPLKTTKVRLMSFIIRIELNSNILADFNVLHQAMHAKGFSQTITSDDGVEYRLPKATYY